MQTRKKKAENKFHTPITAFYKKAKSAWAAASSKSALSSKVTSPNPDINIFNPASSRSPSEPLRRDNEERSLRNPDSVGELPQSNDSLARKGRARAAHARANAVPNLISLLKTIRNGKYKSKKLLIKRHLTLPDYQSLLAAIASSGDEGLQAFFKDKLR
jgi:hypothetical protein